MHHDEGFLYYVSVKIHNLEKTLLILFIWSQLNKEILTNSVNAYTRTKAL